MVEGISREASPVLRGKSVVMELLEDLVSALPATNVKPLKSLGPLNVPIERYEVTADLNRYYTLPLSAFDERSSAYSFDLGLYSPEANEGLMRLRSYFDEEPLGYSSFDASSAAASVLSSYGKAGGTSYCSSCSD